MIPPMSARNLVAGSILSDEQGGGAYFFDGQSAAKHPVDITFGAEALTIHPLDGGEPVVCRYEITRRIQPFTPDDHVALRPNTHSGARLVLTDPSLIARLRQHAPTILDPPFLRRSRIRRWTAIAATLLAAALVFMVVIPAASSVFALLIPDATKRAVGANTVKELFEPAGLCVDPDGTRVLDHLSGQLASVIGLDEDVDIHVAKVPMVNAFALPGRHMILTKKLIEKARTSAEVAAVIAHELGHMKLNHPTEAYFRRGLISAVADAIFGGGFGSGGFESIAALAITLGYSRDDESAADAIAIEALNAAGITSQGMADFFGRETGTPEALRRVMEWLSTHPGDDDRQRRALEQGTGRNQALAPEDWRSLRDICG